MRAEAGKKISWKQQCDWALKYANTGDDLSVVILAGMYVCRTQPEPRFHSWTGLLAT